MADLQTEAGDLGATCEVKCEVDTDATQTIIDVAYIPIRTK